MLIGLDTSNSKVRNLNLIPEALIFENEIPVAGLAFLVRSFVLGIVFFTFLSSTSFNYQWGMSKALWLAYTVIYTPS